MATNRQRPNRGWEHCRQDRLERVDLLGQATAPPSARARAGLTGWILHIRLAVLAIHDRSPVPGSVTLLAPHYREGMELIYEGVRQVRRQLAHVWGRASHRFRG